jgi:predicted nucleic acid-binding protein
MNKVFLDTNILLDYYLNRSGADMAEEVFKKANCGIITLYASALTFANFAYVLKRLHTREEVYSVLDEIEKLIYALPMNQKQLRASIDAKSKDFEDMLQYQCALAGGCDVILTNNKKDFIGFSQLPLCTAEEYIKTIA